GSSWPDRHRRRAAGHRCAPGGGVRQRRCADRRRDPPAAGNARRVAGGAAARPRRRRLLRPRPRGEPGCRGGAAGVDAASLAGGITQWRELGLPTRRRIGAAPGKWVTRERPKVDRIACPWLVRRFIDPEAEFLYVPSAEVQAVAARTGAVPYDVAEAEFGHVGERCSFDAFIRLYGISDRALDRLALIVRGADTGRPDLAPQSPGLL